MGKNETAKLQVDNDFMKFEAQALTIKSWTVVLIPTEISKLLPSRGLVFVEGDIDGVEFLAAAEPDGKGSHWFQLPENIKGHHGTADGAVLKIQLRSSENWPQPDIPEDFAEAINSDLEAKKLWQIITPMARWDWMRWIRSTASEETRKRRITVAVDKLRSGERRPCCFNRTMCTVPEITKSGVLLAFSSGNSLFRFTE